MRRLIFALLLSLPIVTVATGYAGDGDGGYAGAFYQVPVGARPTAMGGAYLAVSDDGAAALFNPAGIARLARPLASSSYRAMKLGRTLGYASAMFPVRGQATMGASWLFAGSGKVEVRDADGYLEGRDFYQNTHQFSVVFAKLFERRFSLGVNISYLVSDMPEFDANSVGFDFGAMLYVNEFFGRERRDSLFAQDMRVGVVVRHISKKLRWVSDKYNLQYTTSESGYVQEDKVPAEFGLGVSARFMQRKLLVAADILKNEKQDPLLHVGAEYYVRPEFALRSGLSDGRFVAGTGYLFHIGQKQLAIDYAFSLEKVDEGSEHIFSFDLLF